MISAETLTLNSILEQVAANLEKNDLQKTEALKNDPQLRETLSYLKRLLSTQALPGNCEKAVAEAIHSLEQICKQ